METACFRLCLGASLDRPVDCLGHTWQLKQNRLAGADEMLGLTITLEPTVTIRSIITLLASLPEAGRASVMDPTSA